MSESVRAFVAVSIPVTTPLRDILNELARMGHAVKPVAPENLHITLKFLGETDWSWIDRTCEVLNETALSISKFDINVQGLGAFPKATRPSIIWAGIAKPKPMLDLAHAVEASLTSFGFGMERRPFHAHITLARVKGRSSQQLITLLESHSETIFAKIRVAEIVLMKSELTPNGPIYSTIHFASLK